METGGTAGAPAVMKKTFLLPIALAALAFLLLPMPGRSAPLSSRIEDKRQEIEKHRAKEGVLSTTIARFGTRIEAVQGEIGATERRLARVQDSLDRQKAELLAVRNRLEAARDRLERLRSELVTARRVLAARLVEIYKADSPDALTVILSSDGFGDLLERAEFLKRISEQDRHITDRVRKLRDTARDQAVQLADLEEQEQFAAERILRERDQVAAVEDQLTGARDRTRRQARGARAGARQPRGARGRPRGPRARAGTRAGRPPGRGPNLRWPREAGERRADLAGERTGRVALRDAVGTPARRHRHRGPVRNGDPRRRLRPRCPHGLGRGLRQLHLHPAQRDPLHVLRAPVELRDLQRRLGQPGPGDRLQRLHGPLLRPAPALRDAHQRRARRPHGLPLAA